MKGSIVYKNVLIIISALMIFNCGLKQGLRILHTPQPGEKPVGKKIEMFDNPLKVSSTEKNQKFILFCIRQSESLTEYKTRSVYKKNIRSAPADWIYVIFTIETRADNGRRIFIEEDKLTSGKKKRRLNKIAKDDIILFDNKGNSYYFSAFTFASSKFEGYFFDYYLFQNLDYPYDALKRRIDYKDKRVIQGGWYYNLVFLVPKESVLDYLLIGESKLKIPNN